MSWIDRAAAQQQDILEEAIDDYCRLLIDGGHAFFPNSYDNALVRAVVEAGGLDGLSAEVRAKIMGASR